MMECLKLRSYMCKFGYFYIFNHRYFGRSKFYFFSLDAREKLKFLGAIMGGKGPNLYTGPWALVDDVDTSKEKKMIGEAP